MLKKALIISNSSGLVSDFLENDIKILKDKGYSIDCACNFKYPGKNTEEFFKQYEIKEHQVDFPIRDLDIKLIIDSFKKIKNILKNNDYDVIHCHSTIAAVIGRECGKKHRKKYKTKILYTSHGFPFYEGVSGKKAQLFKIIEKYYSKYTDAIITICNEDYEEAKKMKCKNVYKINGVGFDYKRISDITIDREEYRKKLGFKKDDFVVLSIGELNTNKNHQIIIKALSKINNPNILYAICGREVTEIGKKQQLEDLANSLNVRITFLGFRQDIPEVTHCAEIGAISSHKEGLGLSGVEMLSAGIPVVGSNRQGIKDYIIDGQTGYLCDPNDADSFATGIEKTIELTLNKETKINCKSISEKFSKENAYEKMLNIYNTILS